MGVGKMLAAEWFSPVGYATHFASSEKARRKPWSWLGYNPIDKLFLQHQHSLANR